MRLYKFEHKQDVYSITNEDVVDINYTVKRLFDCNSFIAIADGTIVPGDTKTFEFTEDGEYQIILEDSDIINIKHYLKLQLSIIEGILNTVCDCKCGCECGEDENPYCSLLMLRAKMDVFKRLTAPQGGAFYNAVHNHVKCLIVKPIYCAVDKEIILGEEECNEEIIKQLLALDYLAMYFFEMAQACLTEDKEYVRCKFYTKEIFCCVQSLGIDIGEIEQLINKNMGTFTINNAAYVNLAPSSVGDNTINVGNRATTILTLAMFTTGTTPAYADPEGDLAAKVRIDTLPAGGVLKLSGVAVTAGQEILVADISLNNLTYESPDQDALNSDNFLFSISDAGSGIFSS